MNLKLWPSKTESLFFMLFVIVLLLLTIMSAPAQAGTMLTWHVNATDSGGRTVTGSFDYDVDTTSIISYSISINRELSIFPGGDHAVAHIELTPGSSVLFSSITAAYTLQLVTDISITTAGTLTLVSELYAPPGYQNSYLNFGGLFHNIQSGTLSTDPIPPFQPMPEPTCLVLLLSGLGSLTVLRQRGIKCC